MLPPDDKFTPLPNAEAATLALEGSPLGTAERSQSGADS